MVVMLVSKIWVGVEDATVLEFDVVVGAADEVGAPTDEEVENEPGSVGAVCAVDKSIVVVIDTSPADRAPTSALAVVLTTMPAVLVAVDAADDVPTHPHHFQHCQLWAFLSKPMSLRSA